MHTITPLKADNYHFNDTFQKLKFIKGVKKKQKGI